MKKVYQKSIDQGIGDCTAACVASILEVNLEDIPNFNLPDASHYSRNIAKWVQTSGWAYIGCHFEKFEPVTLDDLPHEFEWFVSHGAYCLLSVPSQKFKDGWHHVVGRFNVDHIEEGVYNSSCAIVHDPNPDNKIYDPVETKVRSVAFLVPNS